MSDVTERLLERLARIPSDASEDATPALVAPFDRADLSVAGLQRLLSGVSPAPEWWDPTTGIASFPRIDLRGCSLRSARLAALSGNRIDFSGADLAGASLAGGMLGGGIFDAALLEDADLSGAHLRFASLRDSVLEGARLRETDLRGAILAGAQLDRADFRGADLEEADLRGARGRDVDFRGARLALSNLRTAALPGADLRDCLLRGARLDGADLRHANLEQADLTSCTLDGIWLSDAKLDRTKLNLSQLGPSIGEERHGEFELARRAYLTLELNFLSLGDPDTASWIYRRRRRVQKLAARSQARAALRSRKWKSAVVYGTRYLTDKIVELTCDYGESVPRVMLSLVFVFFGFLLCYGMGGAVVEDLNGAELRAVTRDPLDLMQFTLTAMLAPGSAPEGMHLAGRAFHVIALLQSFLSIFLIGLLGFVAGNRIRR